MGASIQKRLEKVMADSKAIIDTLKEDVHYFIADKDMFPSNNNMLPPEKRRVLMKAGAEAIAKAMDLTAEFSDPIVVLSAPANPNSGNVVVRCHMKNKSGEQVASGMGSYEVINVPFNTAIKMASKSAHIDATIRAAGISDSFTQDIIPNTGGVVARNAQPCQPAAQPVAQLTASANVATTTTVSAPAPSEANKEQSGVASEETQKIVPEPTSKALELINWIKKNVDHADDIPAMHELQCFEQMTVQQLKEVIDQWHGVDLGNASVASVAEPAKAEAPAAKYSAGGLLGDIEGELELA
jgi:hypothetical protein